MRIFTSFLGHPVPSPNDNILFHPIPSQSLLHFNMCITYNYNYTTAGNYSNHILIKLYVFITYLLRIGIIRDGMCIF